MKVTVCFGPVRVVVPCGNGDILVRDLIQQAVVRYRKAAGKAPDAWVGVTALRSSDGALLDLDDRLRDVVDDREQLVACTGLEDTPGLTLPLTRDRVHNPRGDGTSASSDASSPSPDFLQGTNHTFQPFSRKDIEVTGGENIPSATLQVRRGSEPVLNRLTPEPHTVVQRPESPKAKRWSAAAVIDELPTGDRDHNENLYTIRPGHDNLHYSSEERERGGSSVEVRRQRFLRHENDVNANDRYSARFSRTGPRVSMQINAYRWAEAADAALRGTGASSSYGEDEEEEDEREHEETEHEHRRTRSLRREPVGATSNPSPLPDGDAKQSELVVLVNEGGPLGIHVVPDYDAKGQDNGLLVQGIEPGGRVARDGRLQLQDRIIEINGHPLLRVPFHRAQEVFRQAMQAPELRLRVVKRSHLPAQQQQHHPKQLSASASTDRGESPANNEERFCAISYSDEREEDESRSVNAKVATITPTRKSANSPPATATGVAANMPGSQGNVLMTGNTRKLGKKLQVELVKGNNGLGFSVTTRDNPAGAQCPIYIKNVLPKGAAIEDGRLKAGDRLLEVNGTEVTGLSQEEVVTLLRGIPAGGTATILISRLQDDEASPKLPRQMKTLSHASEESLIFPWKHREILTLDIPVHDSERAGLGVSVKGKTSTAMHGTVDLGIFVKSVIHGGAASRDGRLRTNDQLLHVNGYSLLGRSNSEAMETLRKAVHQEGPIPGVISLTVARKVNQQQTAFSGDRDGEPQQQTSDISKPAMQESSQSNSSPDNNHASRLLSLPNGNNSGGTDSSGYSDQSGSTVIFVGEGGQRYTGKIDDQDLGTLTSPPRNPVIDRLTGRQTFHNESYYRATHDTWNATQLQEMIGTGQGGSGRSSHSPVNRNFQPPRPQSSPTVTAASGEVVTIEGDYQPQRPRPPALPAYNRAGTPDSFQGRYYMPGNGELPRDAGEGSEPPPSPSVKSDRPSDSDAPTYASQTSLDESGPGFSRDQIGRQSMSEKRHAVLDAKNTDTYQRNKKVREERDRQRQMQLQMQQEQMQQQREAGRNKLPVQSIVPSPPSRGCEMDAGLTLGEFYALTSTTNTRGYPLPLRFVSGTPARRGIKRKHPVVARMETEYTPLSSSAGRRNNLLRTGSSESLSGSRCQSTTPLYAEVRKRRDIGPTLGMKKSSSLESLQTMVQEIQEEETVGCYGYRPATVRVVRGRGCNESFRAAVDRSYDAPIEEKGAMETLDEEGGEGDRSGPMQLLTAPGTGLADTSDDKNKKGKKKPGLLKGLGSMFRFGKNRRGLENSGIPRPTPEMALFESNENIKTRERRPSAGAPSSKPEVDRHHVLRRTLPSEDRGELSRVLARQAAQEEQRRIQEQYRRLVEQQQRQQPQPQQQPPPHPDPRLGPPEPPARSKSSEKFHYIRAEHQRRHAERQGQYLHDERDEKYEQALRQRFEPSAQTRTSPNNKPTEVIHARSASYDPYNEVRGPGSRVGVISETGAPPAGPGYDQYVNFQEAQHQIRQCLSPPPNDGFLSPMQMWAMQETVRRQRLKVEAQSRRQQHYHSQRGFRENRDPRGDRPVSNYFEYESLQQRSMGGSTLPWNPPRPPFGPPFLPPSAPGHGHGQAPPRNANTVDSQNNSLSRKHARTHSGGNKGPAPVPPIGVHTLPGYRSQNQGQYPPPVSVRTIPGAPGRPMPSVESYRPYGPPFALAGSKV